MNTLKNTRIEVWYSNIRKQPCPMVTLQVDFPEGSPLRYIWFVFTLEEWQDALTNKRDSFSDGYHKLATFYDLWTFYDFPYDSQESTGKATIPYGRITIPRQVREKLLIGTTLAFLQHALTKTQEERVTINLDHYVADWLEEYGQGKGRVYIDCDTATLAKVNQRLINNDATFKRCWDQLKSMAKNTTESKQETGTLKVWRDSDGFTWRTAGLFGGLINHGTDIQPEWSLHT